MTVDIRTPDCMWSTGWPIRTLGNIRYRTGGTSIAVL